MTVQAEANIFLSLVIPAHNSARTLAELLPSINQSSYCDFEVLVVDDASSDPTAAIGQKYGARVIRLPRNQGAAAARNQGAKAARGAVLVFFDSDTILKTDTLAKIARAFKSDPQMIALIGNTDKESPDRDFFKEYKSLLDYWHWQQAPGQTVTSFEPRIGAVRRDIFWQAGGFDESFAGATVEDYEFGYRLLKIGPIHLDKENTVWHHSSGFGQTLKNYYIRGSLWLDLFWSRKRFDNVGTTASAGLGKLLSLGGLICLMLALLLRKPGWWFLTGGLLMIYFLVFNRLFLFLYKERGLIFASQAFFYDYLLALVLTAAALASAFKQLLSLVRPRLKHG